MNDQLPSSNRDGGIPPAPGDGVLPSEAEPLKKSRILGYLAGFLGVILLLAGGGLYFAYSRYLSGSALKAQFEQRLSSLLGLPVTVADIRLNFPGVTLHGISIGNSSEPSLPFASLNEVSGTPDYRELLSGNVVVENLSVASATLSLVRDPSGKLVLPAGAFAIQTGPGEQAQFPLRSFHVDNLHVRLEDQASGKSFDLHVANGEFSKEPTGKKIEVRMDGTLAGFFDLSVTGACTWLEEVKGTVALTNVHLVNIRPLLPPSVQIPEELSAPAIAATVAYWWSGRTEISELVVSASPHIVLKGAFSAASLVPMQGSGTISLDSMPVAEILALAKPYFPEKLGDISVQGGTTEAKCDLVYSGGALDRITVWAKPQGVGLTYGPLGTPVEKVFGDLTFAGDQVRWDKLSMEIAGAKISSEQGEMALGEGFPGQGTLAFKGELGPVLQALARFLTPAQARMKVKGAVDFSGSVKKTAKGSTLTGNVTVSQVHLLAPPDGIPVEITSGKASFADLGPGSPGQVRWEGLVMKVAKAEISSRKGEVQTIAGYPGKGDLVLKGEIEPVLQVFARFLPASVEQLSLKGALDFAGTLTIKGLASTLTGTATLSKVNFLSPKGNIPILVETAKGKMTDLGKSSGSVAFEDVRVQVLGSVMTARGTLENAEDPKIALEAGAELELAHLQQILPSLGAALQKQMTMSGKASVAAKVSGKMSRPQVTGTVILADAAFSYPEKGIQMQQISAKVQGDASSVKLEQLKAVFADGKLALNGTIENFADPVISVSGTLAHADLASIQGCLKQVLPQFPKGLDVTGKADLEVDITGPAARPEFSGKAALLGSRIFHPVMMRPLTDVNGSVRFDNQGLQTEGLAMDWGTSKVKVSGRVKDLSRFSLACDVSVQPLDLTDIGTFFLGSAGYKVIGSGNGSGKITGPLDHMEISGTATLPSVRLEVPIAKGEKKFYVFPFATVVAPFHLSEGVFSVTHARASLFGGALDGSGKAFLKETPIRFQFDSKADSLQTQEFLAQNSNFKDALAGPLDLTFSSAGNTSGLDTWNGNGSLNMKSGTFRAPPVVAPILTMLDLGQFASGDLTRAHGTFVLKSGRLNTEDLDFASAIGHASFKGSVGLDSTLSGRLILSFSKQAVEQSQILRQFSPDGTGVDIPTKVEGTLGSPAFPGFSPGRLIELGLQRKGKQMLQEALLGKSPGQNGTEASGTAQPQADPKSLLMGGLQDLLKGKAPEVQPQNPPPAPPDQAAPPPPAPEAPKKQVENELKKKLGSELQKLFKF